MGFDASRRTFGMPYVHMYVGQPRIRVSQAQNVVDGVLWVKHKIPSTIPSMLSYVLTHTIFRSAAESGCCLGVCLHVYPHS